MPDLRYRLVKGRRCAAGNCAKYTAKSVLDRSGSGLYNPGTLLFVFPKEEAPMSHQDTAVALARRQFQAAHMGWLEGTNCPL